MLAVYGFSAAAASATVCSPGHAGVAVVMKKFQADMR
jgi:hypothetical protein